jgi:hypothetical protein
VPNAQPQCKWPTCCHTQTAKEHNLMCLLFIRSPTVSATKRRGFFWAAINLLNLVKTNRVEPRPVQVDSQPTSRLASFSGFSRSSFSSSAFPRKSSVRRSTMGRKPRRKKRVRFMGVASPYTTSFLPLLVHVFRSGSPVVSRWEFLVACVTCAGVCTYLR